MGEKKVRKNVKFDYYDVVLEIDEEYIENRIRQLKKECRIADDNEMEEISKKIEYLKCMQENSEELSEPFDLKDIIEAIRNNKITPIQKIQEKHVELDINTFLPDEENSNIIYFQMCNNREFGIPSKKREGFERTPIELDDDEYIGEFMGIIYDTRTYAAMIQVNKYCMNISQLSFYFSIMRNEYLKYTNQEEDRLYRVNFIPIISKNMLNKMEETQTFTKLSMKGSNVSLCALAKNNSNALYHMEELMKEFCGVKFELVLSVNSQKKEIIPLSRKKMLQVYNDFKKLEKGESPDISVTYKNDGKAEAVNWLLPKMQSIITFITEPRITLGHDYVFKNMEEEFRTKEDEIITRSVYKKQYKNN